MLTIRKVTPTTENINEIKRLYKDSFPQNERRNFDNLMTMGNGKSEIIALYDGDIFCGFVSLLNGNVISHIIYFAIEEELRGHGYGSDALKVIHEYQSGRRVIVDIEQETETAPNNEQRRRRKQFYFRNGYAETEIKYNWRNEDYEILSFGGNVTEEEFEAFWEEFEA